MVLMLVNILMSVITAVHGLLSCYQVKVVLDLYLPLATMLKWPLNNAQNDGIDVGKYFNVC